MLYAINSDLLEVDLPVSVYWDSVNSYYTDWYQGKVGAPVLPTHILWDIDDSAAAVLYGQVAAISSGVEFGPVPERTVEVGLKFVPTAITSYSSLFTTASNAETEAEVALSGDWIITTVYVKETAEGTGSGIDWTNAMTDLCAAVNKAKNEAIPNVYVAGGTYTPSELQEPGKGPRFKSFRMYNDLVIQGSFTGNITDPTEQDLLDPSILSGDLGNDSCYHVLYLPDNQGLLSTAILKDVVLTGGNAEAYRGVAHSIKGGGLYCGTGNTPIFNNVAAEQNNAVIGGGIYVKEATPSFTDCSALENTATHGAGIYYDNCTYEDPAAVSPEISYNVASGNGGGIYNNNSVIPMQSAKLTENKAVTGGGYYQKGSSASGSMEPLRGVGSEITNNRATSGGGIAILTGDFTGLTMLIKLNKAVSGGGIYIDDSIFSIKDAILFKNEARNGGGVMARNSYAILDRNTFSGNSALQNGGGVYFDKNTYNAGANSVFMDNTAKYGAGVYTERSAALLAGITAVRNIASVSGGFVYGKQCEIDVYGCAFQDNLPLAKQVAGDRVGYTIKSPAMFIPGQEFEEIAEGSRIEVTDLGFIDYSNNDLHLDTGSVMIGVCDETYFPSGMKYDRDDVLRDSSESTSIGAYAKSHSLPTIYMDTLTSIIAGEDYDFEGTADCSRVEVVYRVSGTEGAWVSLGSTAVVGGNWTKTQSIPTAGIYDIRARNEDDVVSYYQYNSVTVTN